MNSDCALPLHSIAAGYAKWLDFMYLQPICIAELTFVPEISIRNLDKSAGLWNYQWRHVMCPAQIVDFEIITDLICEVSNGA